VTKLGILGGSFDPVHTGHLIVAQDVLIDLSLDEVILMPACIPPHKIDRQLAPSEHRLEMLDLATESNPRLRSSDIELARDGVSYTVDTVRELFSTSPAGTEIYFILGSDNLPDLHEWKQPWELVKLCKLVTMHRPGYEEVEIPPKLVGHHKSVTVTSVNISSRDIRERIRVGKPISYLVPEKVEKYIHEQGLYRK